MVKKVRIVNKHASSSAPSLAAVPEPSTRWTRTTLGIRPEQLQALREVALERAAARGGAAKADVGELVREILDAWLRVRP